MRPKIKVVSVKVTIIQPRLKPSGKYNGVTTMSLAQWKADAYKKEKKRKALPWVV